LLNGKQYNKLGDGSRGTEYKKRATASARHAIDSSFESGVRQRGDGRCARAGSARTRSSGCCGSRRPERGPRRSVCRRHGISTTAFYKWKARYGGLEVSEARRLKALEDENRRLKKLLAEAMLDVAALKDLLAKN
jgi:putative transposase